MANPNPLNQRERDPVSVLWDGGAAALLQRARKARGGWQGTRIADPDDRQLAALRELGIDPLGPDRPSAVGGRAKRGQGLDAKTRWARGFARAVFYLNDPRHGGDGLALDLEFGVHKPRLGVIPAGRAVRLRVRRGGQVAHAAVQRKGEAARIFTADGSPGGRWSDPDKRDW